MMPAYKKIMQLAPHCPVCKEVLLGNGSSFSPWRCSCGTWRWSVGENGVGTYVARKKRKVSNAPGPKG